MSRFPFLAAGAATRFFARSFALAGLVLAVAARPAQAQHAALITVSSPDAESIRVRIDNAAGLPGLVQVLSLNTGRVLFHEAYDAPAYGHRFSFRELPAGRYLLLLHAAGTQYRYTLQVQRGPAGQAVSVRHLKARGPQLLLAGAQ